jgi:hypothetical protein
MEKNSSRGNADEYFDGGGWGEFHFLFLQCRSEIGTLSKAPITENIFHELQIFKNW